MVIYKCDNWVDVTTKQIQSQNRKDVVYVRKMTGLLIVFVLLVTAIPAPKRVEAYNVGVLKHANTYIKVRYAPNEQNRAITFLGYAKNSWNNYTPQIEFHYSSETSSIIFFQSQSIPNADWEGMTYISFDGYTLYITSEVITINRAHSSWLVDDALQSAIAHELGHALGLLDYSGYCIMNPSLTYRNYYGIIGPKPDDWAGVDVLYP